MEQVQCQNGETAKRKTAETDGTTILSASENPPLKINGLVTSGCLMSQRVFD